MTYESYSDEHRQTLSSIRIDYVGQDVTKYVVFSETQFESIAGATPGTCSIALRGDPAVMALLDTGSSIKLTIDGEVQWQGYASMVTRGYFFANKAQPKVTIQGVDLNVLFDRLIVYNHIEPTKWPTGVDSTGGPAFPKGEVPVGTSDRYYIMAMLRDTDLDLIVPRLKTNLIAEIGSVAPDDVGSTVSSGTTIRGLFEDATNQIVANTNQAGSVIWYIDPKGQIIYNDIDVFDAPFSVSDDGSSDVACRELEITKDASHLKNDVLVFAGELSPDPDSKQELFKYAHRYSASSIAQYGRFQYAETIPVWSGTAVGARARKILDQERTPGLRASFSVYKPGLFPGQLLNVSAGEFGFLEKIPIRSMSTRFETPNLAKFSVSCSYDTNDPWGVLLALQRPASRGLVQPRLQTVRLLPGQDPQPQDYYTHIEEIPTAKGGGEYQCSYKYVRNSLVVYIEGLHARRAMDAARAESTDFVETDPTKGLFETEGVGKIWVAYHTAGNL